MTTQKIKPEAILSTIWIFILFNMIFRDLHQFGNKGFLEEIMTGVVDGVEITDELMLVGGVLVEIPIVMVLLSRILNYKVNKWANIMASVITMLILLSGLPSADMDDIFFLIIEVAAFISIIIIAWKLPSGVENSK